MCLPRRNERQSTFLEDVWSSSWSMPLVRGSWAAFDGIADWIGADMAKGLEGVGALGTGSDGMRKCFERGCWMIRASRSLLPHHQGQGRESLVRGRASSTWVRGRDSSRRCSEETVEVVVESGKVGCPGGLGATEITSRRCGWEKCCLLCANTENSIQLRGCWRRTTAVECCGLTRVAEVLLVTFLKSKAIL